MRKVLVCGSRNVNINLSDIDKVFQENDIHPDLIISGGAKGPDTTAVMWAIANDVPYEMDIPNWAGIGKSAGIERNKKMVDKCNTCVAFWDGKSRGTMFTIEHAREKGKKVVVVER